MTEQKIKQVCDIYWRQLTRMQLFPNERLAHVRKMLPKISIFALDGRLDKASRWLGFVQGVLWAEGIYTIDQLKTHNRPDEEKAVDDTASV